MTQLEIRTAVNSRLGKSVAANGLTAQIQAVVEEMSEMANWPDLYTEADLAFFTAGLKLNDTPAGMRTPDVVWIDGYRPMDWATFKQIQRYQEQENPTTSRPYEYSLRGNSLYVYPLPDQTYTVKLGYWQNHPAIGTEAQEAAVPAVKPILFGDEFTKAVIYGTTAEYLESTGQTESPKLKDNRDRYYAAMALLLPRADVDVVVTKANPYGGPTTWRRRH